MTRPNVHAVHRDWDRDFPIIVRTEGIYLYDADGRRYIDGSGGSSVVTSIGHGVSEIPQVMYEQARAFSFYPAHAFTNQPFLDLSDLVVSLAPGKLKDRSRVWVTCTGTDATDDAVRLARQYWVERGKPSKHQIVTRWQAFHGNNIAVAGFSGLSSRRKIFAPMFVDSPHIPPAFCYRCQLEQTFPECNLLCARMLETTIRQQGPENIAAFIAEPVVGAALGCAPAPDGYFQTIREICDRYDILFIADEVMTGWGRTGKLWGIDHWGVTPDIVATAKGMTAGYTPLSAVIARDDLWAVLESNHSPFKAGHTLNANAVSCAGAIAVIRYSLDHDLTGNAAARGEQALVGLRQLMAKHASIGDVRGRGLMFGFELVKDRVTKEPLAPGLKVSSLLEQAALRHGLVTYPCTGTVDGVLGDMVLMAPPLVITSEQMGDLLGILDLAIGEVEEALSVRPAAAPVVTAA
jgi:adenosylmethionine-8-amino-7-oxononanoate aminotransferase